jgi:DHA1 family inner membrane transport protein
VGRDKLVPNRQPESRAQRSIPLRIVAVLVVGGMAATTNTNVTGLLLSSIADDLGRSVALLGSLRAISASVAFVTAFPLSRVADHYPRKHLILTGLSCMIVAAIFALTAQGLAWFIGYYLFAGAADVILFAMLLAAASDYVDGAALDRANGFVIGAFGLPGFLLVPLAGVISDSFGWRSAYLVSISMAAVALLLVLLLLPVVPPSGSKPESTLKHLRMLAGKPGLLMLLIGNVMRFIILTILIAYTAAYLIERFALSDSRAGLYFGTGSAVFLLAAFASGQLIARLGLRRVMLSGGLVLIATLFVGFLPGIPGLLVAAGLLLSGAILSTHENGSLGAILRIAPHDRGAATSLNELGAAVSGVLGSALGGAVVHLVGFGGLGFALALIALAAYGFTRASLLSAALAPPLGEAAPAEVH